VKFILEKKIIFLYFFAAIIIVWVLSVFYNNTQKVKLTNDLVEHTQEVLRKSDNVLLDVINIETGLRGYLLSGNEEYLKPFYNGATTINGNLTGLALLTKDNPNQQARINTLKKNSDERLILTKRTIEDWKQNRLSKIEIINSLEKGKILTDKIQNIIAVINWEEFKLLNQRKIENDRSNKNSEVLFLALIVFIIVIFALVIIIIKNQTTKNKISKELKQASQYARSLIEASLDPLVTISAEGKITDVNEASVKVIGIPREMLIGTDFSNYFTEPEKARDVYRRVFEKGFVADYPLTIRHIKGKLTNVLYNASVYKGDKNNVHGVVAAARDVTRQKRFENELIESKSNAERTAEKAEESNKLKEAFLANMSHEIRTPMNAIIGFSDILSKANLEEKEKEYVRTIKVAGENLLTIINDILDISKIEAGMMIFEEKTFGIQELFKSLNVMLMGKANEKKLELVFSCDKNIPEVLLGDHTRLTQIIINLAGNAIKFTQKGNIHVHASGVKKNGGTLVEFSVKDTGIGISSDKLEHIFERFRQAESNTTRKYGGTGLGLSIAKQLVELQGGTLSVKSELNIGSVFTFCIPYRKATQIQTKLAVIEKKYNLQDLSKLNILLVEDNPLNVKLILSLFSEYNFKLQIAENGSLGIEKLKENKFDIILMDMEMPVMNGYEAASIIRNELNSNIPIIAMTAHAMAGEREKCLSLGMNDYISKPINANLLFEKMHDLTLGTLIKIESKESISHGNTTAI